MQQPHSNPTLQAKVRERVDIGPVCHTRPAPTPHTLPSPAHNLILSKLSILHFESFCVLRMPAVEAKRERERERVVSCCCWSESECLHVWEFNTSSVFSPVMSITRTRTHSACPAKQICTYLVWQCGVKCTCTSCLSQDFFNQNENKFWNQSFSVYSNGLISPKVFLTV